MTQASAAKNTQVKSVRWSSSGSRSWQRSRWLPLWFLLPALLTLLALQVIPSLYAFYLSTTRLRAGVVEHIGLRNYERLLRSPSFIEGLQNTAIYALSYLLLTVILGMLLALLLNRRIKFTAVYLVIIFIPWVLSDVVAGTMWRWLFQPTYGILQDFVTHNLPFIGQSLYTSPGGSMAIVIAASVWQGLAFTTILSLGALQTVPNEVDESASLDGADRFQRFFLITLPIIRPTLLVMILLISIRAINSVGLIYATTRGGPGRATQTASVFLLKTGWEQGDFGTGAAVSVVLLVINIILTIMYLFVIGRKAD
jgi:ABC-type sugar transport system permease subunit